mgnify:CR=1 FL=1
MIAQALAVPMALPKVARFSKNLAHISALMAGYAGAASLGKLRLKDHDARLKFFTENIGSYSARGMKVFGFDIEAVGYDAELMKRKNFLLVSNHMSYLDVLILSSIQPCVFVTSVDMGNQFFVGQMAEMGGSIFVERRHRGQIDRDLTVMADTLRAGHHVVIYPEGTSSNGESVLPFKKSLLMSAVEAGVDVMPVTLKYLEIDGEPFGPSNRDRVCWYGDMDFFPHFLSLMKLGNVKVRLEFHEPIAVRPDMTRHELAERCYSTISAAYGRSLA